MKWSSHIYVSFINDFFMFFFSGKNFPRIFHEKIFNHVWQIPISRPRESIVSLVWNYRLLIGLVVCVCTFLETWAAIVLWIHMIDFDFSAVVHIPSVEKTSAKIKIAYTHRTLLSWKLRNLGTSGIRVNNIYLFWQEQTMIPSYNN